MVEWRKVPGYEGLYEVSSDGQVRSLGRKTTRGYRKGRILKPYLRPDNGRLQVELIDAQGVRRSVRVHSVVALAFLGPRPHGLHVCHSNGDRLDNRASNLRYDTPKANVADTLRQGMHHQASKTHCIAGHPFDDINTYRRPNGHRTCRACVKERKESA